MACACRQAQAKRTGQLKALLSPPSTAAPSAAAIDNGPGCKGLPTSRRASRWRTARSRSSTLAIRSKRGSSNSQANFARDHRAPAPAGASDHPRRFLATGYAQPTCFAAARQGGAASAAQADAGQHHARGIAPALSLRARAAFRPARARLKLSAQVGKKRKGMMLSSKPLRQRAEDQRPLAAG